MSCMCGADDCPECKPELQRVVICDFCQMPRKICYTISNNDMILCNICEKYGVEFPN